MSGSLNIIFSTTRQWNPGDEFILTGVRRVFDSLGVDFCPTIYNRNPDVRSCFSDLHLFKRSRLRGTFGDEPLTSSLEANVKFDSFDNSIKANTDCSFADWVVLAGTPEWCNGKMADLYSIVRRFQLPLMILGVGGGLDVYREEYLSIIRKAKVITVRDAKTLESVRDKGMEAALLPCPALLSARRESERLVQVVRRVGLIYQAAADETVIWNGCSGTTYKYLVQLMSTLTASLGAQMSFEIICHYVDELPLARRDFPEMSVHYSYDSADYEKIYSRFDIVIGTRVHGIGMAASLGIPGLAIAHDSRGDTCEGFLAKLFSQGTPIEKVIGTFVEMCKDVERASELLLRHKEDTIGRYQAVISAALEERDVFYDALPQEDLPPLMDLEELRPLGALMNELVKSKRDGAAVNSSTEYEREKLLDEMRQRLIHIELKIDAMRSESS